MAQTVARTVTQTVQASPAHLGAAIADLQERVDGEIGFDDGSRAAYSTDGSNLRQVPIGVVVPRTIEDAVAAVSVCHEAHGGSDDSGH